MGINPVCQLLFSFEGSFDLLIKTDFLESFFWAYFKTSDFGFNQGA